MPNLQSLIEQRRRALGSPELPPEGGRVWGLALSGGGIRSATFCLGLLRALAVRQMLLRFDLMSTVSGGGYVGAMLGRLFSRASSADDVRAVAAALADADSRWFTWWLRANGRYLIPRGVKDRTFAFALYLRNLVGVHFELGLLALLLGVALAGIDIAGWAGAWALGYAAGAPFFAAVRFLPDWFPVIGFLLSLAIACGAVTAVAFWCVPWMVRANRVRDGRVLALWAAVLASLLALIAMRVPLDRVQTDVGETLRGVMWWVAVSLLAAWLFAVPVAWRVLCQTGGEPEMRIRVEAVRNRLTRWLANCFRIGAVIIVLGAVDRFAWFLAFEWHALGATGLVLGIIAAGTRALLPLVSQQLQGHARRTAALVLGRVAGYGLAFLLCSWWVSIVYRAALGATFQRVSPNFGDAGLMLAWIGVPLLLYELFTSRNVDFLNLSSLHGFYRARLVRSYLGAANGCRFNGESVSGATQRLPVPMPVRPAHVSVNDLEREDDIAFSAYAPHAHGGPLHLVNVCVNQTRDPRGGLFNQDRRGIALTVCSGGLMRVSQDAWQPLQGPGALTLGTWTAISGAAVAPGLGSHTRGGISALATFAGLRLGYWWDQATRCGDEALSSPLGAKAAGLLRETFGSFRGTERPDWFLTDGGHFENTGAYALLAERAEVIVLADCGADPEYAFGDIENLVRKARIDLQTEVLFQRPKARPGPPPAKKDRLHERYHLARHDSTPDWPDEMEAFGSLNDLASATSTACLALARIEYQGGRGGRGILIVVKPNVSDGLPIDLVNFKAQNPEFPQQSTADQFFSEEQWESYYQLGQFLGGRLTKRFVEELVEHSSEYFEHDDESPFEIDPEHGAAPAPGAAPAGRLPTRIAATAVGATLGLGAAATLGVTAWQAIDSVREAHAKRTAEERAALKELTDLWAKLPPANGSRDADKASGLAAAIVRTADTLCPAGEAGWFRDSTLAKTVYQSALSECGKLDAASMPRSCTTLLEAANPGLQSPLPNCLVRPEEASKAVPPPHYWLFDYASDAPYARAHPCDPAAVARRRFDDLYHSGQLSIAGGGDAGDVDPVLPAECGTWHVDVSGTIHRAMLAAVDRIGLRGLHGVGLPSVGSSTDGEAGPPVAWPPADVGQAASSTAPEGTSGGEPRDRPGRGGEGEGGVGGGGVGRGAGGGGVGGGAWAASAASAASTASTAASGAADLRSILLQSQASLEGLVQSHLPCAGATVYVQIYGPEQRETFNRFRLPWRALGATVPGAEDVLATARANGRVPPLRVTRTTLRVHSPELTRCAKALALVAGHPEPEWKVEALSPRLKPQPGVIEVWVAPKTELKDYD